jgi:hypothetical protein
MKMELPPMLAAQSSFPSGTLAGSHQKFDQRIRRGAIKKFKEAAGFIYKLRRRWTFYEAIKVSQPQQRVEWENKWKIGKTITERE